MCNDEDPAVGSSHSTAVSRKEERAENRHNEVTNTKAIHRMVTGDAERRDTPGREVKCSWENSAI